MRELQDFFGVRQAAKSDLFISIAARPIGDNLRQVIAENMDMALPSGTEKARSEFIIAPILAELRRLADKRISIFSGTEFNVDAAHGLNGRCDFLISRTPYQFLPESPIVVAVEAKQDDFTNGAVHCIAEMIAARIFNQQEGNPTERVYGVITNGELWRFIQLVENTAEIDLDFYELNELEKIMGILWAMTFDEITVA